MQTMAQAKKRQIAFCMTNRCNLNCSYCYTDDAKNLSAYNNIDINFARRLIDDFLPNSDFGVRFYAVGEPTMNMGGIKEIAKYAKTIKPDVNFELQTNGVFSVDVAEWIRDNCSIVWVSIDGPPYIHDSQRVTLSGNGSSAKVLQSVNIMRQNPELKIGGRTTITKNNISCMNFIINHFKSIGLDYGYSKPEFKPQGTMLTPKGIKIDIVGLIEYAKAYEKAYHYGRKKNFFFGSFLTVNFDSYCKKYCRAANALPYATLDGYVSCCDEAYYYHEDMRQLFIGRYDPKDNCIVYWDDNIEILKTRSVENMPECKDCRVRYNCGGQCLAACVFENRDIFTVRKDVCEAVHYLADRIPRNKEPYPCFFP